MLAALLAEPAVAVQPVAAVDLAAAFLKVEEGFSAPPGNPPGLGTLATPMYFRTMPTLKTTTMSPYRNFLDINIKDQKMLWREMVKPSDVHVLLDMTIINSKAIVDLFQSKMITYCWMCFMCVPTAGTGVTATTTKCSPSDKDLYQADLSNFKNLIEEFNHITLE